MTEQLQHKRQWRYYETDSGNKPVKDEFADLSDEDLSEILAEMALVRKYGLDAARHLRGDIYEVRADGVDQSYRILFAKEGRYGQILLALEAFSKKQQRTPPAKIRLAEDRLRDWRERGRRLRAEQAKQQRK